LDVDELQTRLRKMSDEELREFGKAARYMVSSTANMGKPPLPAFVLQLEEARAEWRRRQRSVDLAAALNGVATLYVRMRRWYVEMSWSKACSKDLRTRSSASK
jgi:hypothetical protein